LAEEGTMRRDWRGGELAVVVAGGCGRERAYHLEQVVWGADEGEYVVVKCATFWPWTYEGVAAVVVEETGVV
jgi:hypothetical protein